MLISSWLGLPKIAMSGGERRKMEGLEGREGRREEKRDKGREEGGRRRGKGEDFWSKMFRILKR